VAYGLAYGSANLKSENGDLVIQLIDLGRLTIVPEMRKKNQ